MYQNSLLFNDCCLDGDYAVGEGFFYDVTVDFRVMTSKEEKAAGEENDPKLTAICGWGRQKAMSRGTNRKRVGREKCA